MNSIACLNLKKSSFPLSWCWKTVDFFIHPNNTFAEHEQLNLSCSANVGSPQGMLALWTKKETSSTWEQLKNISDVQNSNCIYIANLTETYILTRQDNGAVFRCSSQNQYTKEPALATDIGPIKVLCKFCFLGFSLLIH